MTTSLIDQATAAAATAGVSTEGENPLLAQHPWYAYMARDERWGKLRAVLDGFEDESVKRRFLPRAEFELQKNWDHRIRISQFLGIAEDAIEQLVGAIMGQEPTFEVDPSLDAFIEDVDGAGTTMQEFTENCIRESVGMGICYVVVDGPTDQLGEFRHDRGKELTAGLNRAFLTLAKAEEITNWHVDRSGKLVWAVLRRVVSEQESHSGDRALFEEFSVYDAREVRRWRRELDADGTARDGERFEEVAVPNAVHGLGVVPIVPLFGRRIGPMRGDSMVKGAARADIAQFNEESWSAMARYRHANPLLKLFSNNDPRAIFSGNVVRLKRNSAEQEDLEYVGLDGSAFEVREAAIERYRRAAVTKAGVNPQQIADSAGSTSGESGIAQRVRFTQTQKRHVDTFSRKLESGIERVLDVAEKWITNPKDPTEKSIRIRSSFEVTEADDLVRRIERVEGLIPSPTLLRELWKQAAKALVGDVSEETTEAILAELEAAKAPDGEDQDPLRMGA